jgi:hypothetical protein
MLETQRKLRKENEIMKKRDRKLNIEVQLCQQERDIVLAKNMAQLKVIITRLLFNLDQLVLHHRSNITFVTVRIVAEVWIVKRDKHLEKMCEKVSIKAICFMEFVMWKETIVRRWSPIDLKIITY